MTQRELVFLSGKNMSDNQFVCSHGFTLCFFSYSCLSACLSVGLFVCCLVYPSIHPYSLFLSYFSFYPIRITWKLQPHIQHSLSLTYFLKKKYFRDSLKESEMIKYNNNHSISVILIAYHKKVQIWNENDSYQLSAILVKQYIRRIEDCLIRSSVSKPLSFPRPIRLWYCYFVLLCKALQCHAIMAKVMFVSVRVKRLTRYRWLDANSEITVDENAFCAVFLLQQTGKYRVGTETQNEIVRRRRSGGSWPEVAETRPAGASRRSIAFCVRSVLNHSQGCLD